MRIVSSSNRRAIGTLLAPERAHDSATTRQVAAIVADVRADGDEALLRYARQFDRLQEPIEVSRKEMSESAAAVPREVRAAIRVAAKNIRVVARRQVPRPWR